MVNVIAPTGRERFFGKDEVIVSKTDLKGRITYANRIFTKIAGYDECELLGRPHNIIRHPAMPRCIFKLLWDTIEERKEFFSYLLNISKNGDHYWVFAHVTPSFDESGQVIGFHSNRRVPEREILEETIIPLYKDLLQEEDGHQNRKDGINAALAMMTDILKEKEMAYDEFIFSIKD